VGELLILLNIVSDPKTAKLYTTMKAVLGSNVDVRAATTAAVVSTMPVAAKQRPAPCSARNGDHLTMSGRRPYYGRA